MEELFMKYSINTTIAYEGKTYRILGYEMHDGRRYVICGDGERELRIEV